ncbi:hypothetical protein PI124_g9051 [Phytophthora idaei]|nr:hypothetical protein PI125_g8436 [Phytophthora idaei]KAG3154223.1 hypothetical protein PI126_g9705 [Phytophthora idaei]KAG3246235.1 hypothetical protein PI124_g9051 [Phytophthora idaei]
MTKGKRAGVICTFPRCNKTMTSKFKQHFQRHFLEMEAYDITQSRGGAVSTSAPREEPATSAPDSSASSDDEDIDMTTTELLAQEHPMEAPVVADDVARRTRWTHGRVLRALRNLS